VARSRSSRLDARDLALVAVFAAVIAVLGMPGAIAVPGLAVPITAQTLGVMLAGSILGARRGALAVLVFLALVAAGLPLLSGGRGGLSVFVGASAGFLIGWVFGAYVTGALVERRPDRFDMGWIALANIVGGILVVYAFGIPVMAWVGDLSIGVATVRCLAFLPGDLIKVAIATVVTTAVLRGYPAAAPPRRRDAVGARKA
jgi:biotin transport system substrate-specific component